MSMSADVLMFDRKELIDGLIGVGCYNKEVVEDTLDMFGKTVCDKYIILVNEHYADDAMYLLCRTIESLFDIECATDLIYDTDFEYIGGGCTDYNWADDDKVFDLAVRLKKESIDSS